MFGEILSIPQYIVMDWIFFYEFSLLHDIYVLLYVHFSHPCDTCCDWLGVINKSDAILNGKKVLYGPNWQVVC